MAARLKVIKGQNAGRVVTLSGPATLGREPGCEVVLTDAGISRKHARIEPVAGGWRVTDLGSRNGTVVNGVEVQSSVLSSGDRIRLWDVELQFEEATSSDVRSAGQKTFISDDPGPAPHVVDSIDSEWGKRLVDSGDFTSVEELRRGYDTLRAAHELASILGTEQDQDCVIDLVLSFCFRALPADTGAVVLRETATAPFSVHAAYSRLDGSEPVVISRSILGELERQRAGLLVMDASADARYAVAKSIMASGIRSVLAVPLIVRDEFRGAIFLDNRVSGGAFTKKHLQLVVGIAAQAALAVERLELMDELERQARTRAHLARFLAPEVVEQVVRGAMPLERGGRYAQIAVLFCDIRGFTRLSARLGPQVTMELLNEYFEGAVDEVFRFGGMVDKFVGDELMAVWGVPEAASDDLERALQCALAIQERLTRVKVRLDDGNWASIQCGIGITSGTALVGLLGSSKRMQYTVIGDTVNVASRLCGVAGPGEVVTMQLAVNPLMHRFRVTPLPPLKVKGKDEPLSVATVERLLGRGGME